MSNSTMEELLVHEWNVWETQTMVLLSFMLQLSLLATGSLRRRNTNGVLRALIWLGYVGADVVAVYALGLFTQYEDKYKLGRESFGDTLPFLWVPFLLVHLGGQDSITAFSLEDNNLWLRHLLNLATQGVLALYVLWKSFHRMDHSVLIPAMLVFVSGIIKYGERVWTLKSGSRNGLGKSSKLNSQQSNIGSKESYALQTVHLARGLFAGRTVDQLGNNAGRKLEDDFKKYEEREEKLKMVEMELDMMFDLLYTKANVLQRWTGVLFRCASQTLMVVAFLLFFLLMRSEKGGARNHNRVNVTITYILFSGAIFMETCSVAVVMASPWTRARLKDSRFLHGLCSFDETIRCCNKRHRASSTSTSIGQFNFMDYCCSRAFNFKVAFGLDKQWRNLLYVHHVDDSGIINGVLEILATVEIPAVFRRVDRKRLNYTLRLPFEHAIYRLHLYTDLHLTRYFAACTGDDVIMRLKEECETLSNYMMYLMVVHPSMLPVSTAAEDIEPQLFNKFHYYSNRGMKRLHILQRYERRVASILSSSDSGTPFQPEENGSSYLEQSLKEMKAIWLWLLVYAAGKCSGELHARQLGEGGELITIVWLLMVHHGIGDVARELNLLTSDDPAVPEPGSLISDTEEGEGTVTATAWRRQQFYEIKPKKKPLYAFDFHCHGDLQ